MFIRDYLYEYLYILYIHLKDVGNYNKIYFENEIQIWFLTVIQI